MLSNPKELLFKNNPFCCAQPSLNNTTAISIEEEISAEVELHSLAIYNLALYAIIGKNIMRRLVSMSTFRVSLFCGLKTNQKIPNRTKQKKKSYKKIQASSKLLFIALCTGRGPLSTVPSFDIFHFFQNQKYLFFWYLKKTFIETSLNNFLVPFL